MTDPSPPAAAAVVAAHLRATRGMALDRTAERWIDEADAVAADLVDAGGDTAVIASRLRTVEQLLENVDSTGHAHADAHVAKAKHVLEASCSCDRSEP